MDHDTDQLDTVKALAPPTTSVMFAMVGALFGLSDDMILKAGAVSATAIAQGVQLAGAYSQRKKKRVADRYYRMYDRLHKRVEKLEEKVFSEQETDLFVSVMQGALADDEAHKEPFYVAVLEWMLKEKPPAVHVRILAGAVQTLSHLELYCFLHENAGKGGRKHQSDLDEIVRLNRLSGAGLSHGATSRVRADATSLGKTLAKYCDLAELEKPSGWRGP